MPVSPTRYDLLHGRVKRFTRILRGSGLLTARALHRTRVASRRLRELLPVLQLEGKVSAELGRRLRKVTQRLGPVRELDVTLQLVDQLRRSGGDDSIALDQVAVALSRERDDAWERLPAKWPSREIRRVGPKLVALADHLKSTDRGSAGRTSSRGLRWAVDARLYRRAASLKSAIQDAGSVYLPARLHEVRIALKKFRYALELANELSPDDGVAAQLGRLKRDQNLLGRLHDRQVLIDRVRQLQASLTPPNISASRRLDALVTNIEKDCRRLHARYVRESPALLAACPRGSRSPAARRAS